MPLYSGGWFNDTDGNLTVSVQAVDYPIRLVRFKAFLRGSVTGTAPGFIQVVSELTVGRINSPSYTGTTTAAAEPLRQSSDPATAVVRVNGTHNGTRYYWDRSYDHQYAYSADASASQGGRTMAPSNTFTSDPSGDTLVNPGSSFFAAASVAATTNMSGSTPSSTISMIWTFEEIRQLSLPA